MNLKEYLQPLMDIYGIGTIAKLVDKHPNAIYMWYERGLPMSEAKGETIYRAKLARLAREHESTKHITIKGLGKYINNAKGD